MTNSYTLTPMHRANSYTQLYSSKNRASLDWTSKWPSQQNSEALNPTALLNSTAVTAVGAAARRYKFNSTLPSVQQKQMLLEVLRISEMKEEMPRRIAINVKNDRTDTMIFQKRDQKRYRSCWQSRDWARLKRKRRRELEKVRGRRSGDRERWRMAVPATRKNSVLVCLIMCVLGWERERESDWNCTVDHLSMLSFFQHLSEWSRIDLIYTSIYILL